MSGVTVAKLPARVTPPGDVLDPERPPFIEGFTPSAQRGREEDFGDKFMRKSKENPFVPIGVLATACVLTLGLAAFRRGDTRSAQRFMRMRVMAQGLTVVALMGGVVIGLRG